MIKCYAQDKFTKKGFIWAYSSRDKTSSQGGGLAAGGQQGGQSMKLRTHSHLQPQVWNRVSDLEVGQVF